MEKLNTLREPIYRLETVEAACDGAVAEDRHASFVNGPYQKSIRAVRRERT